MKRFCRLAGASLRAGARIGLALLALCFITTPPAVAQSITPIFIAPSQPLTAGSRVSLWLYCLNDSPSPVRQTFEPTLHARWVTAGGPVAAALLLNTNDGGGAATIAPGGFVKAEYLVDVPASISGSLRLETAGYNEIAITVLPGTVGPATTAGAQAPPAPKAVSTNMVQFLDDHLSPYEPTYFILGTFPAAEFQFSIKYKVFNFKEGINPLSHFYFAYTQTSFWDLISSDPSFYDSSYKPSAFLYYTNVLSAGPFQLDLQPGIEHESNGRGGSLERSLYTAYLQPTATINLPENLQFMLQPRAWSYLDVGDNNSDIAEYRGYGEVSTALTWRDPDSAERIQLGLKWETGDEATHEAWKIDLRFNLADVPFLDRFNPTIQVQYFTGYGQTLRQYNQNSHGLRAGLCLWY